MTLPAPNLDDRTFRDIVDEAIRLIPKYCPEWTNHNPSDPGITLLELFGWMTEMMIYRLNKIPDKTYVALLDLIGIRLAPPQPASTLLTFTLSEGTTAEQVVERGTQVATEQTAQTDAVVFETEKDLVVVPVAIKKIISQVGDKFTDNSELLTDPTAQPREIFGGAHQIERLLYLGDERFSALGGPATVSLHFRARAIQKKPVSQLLEWEYWNGKRFKELPAQLVRPEVSVEGETIIALTGPLPEVQVAGVDGKESFFVRGRLIDIPETPEDAEIDTITLEAHIEGEGVAPDLCLVNIASGIFLPLDLSKNFYPFSEQPKFDHAFYVSSSEVFSKKDSTITMEVVLTDPSAVDTPQPSKNLELVWEYFAGKKWKLLGKSNPGGVILPQGDLKFTDTTFALTRDGSISFERPPDLAETEVGGAKGYWLRCRISQGDYGIPGRYEQAGSTWVWKDDRPLKPPSLSVLGLKYAQKPSPLRYCLGFNDFTYQDFSEIVSTEYKPFTPFAPVTEKSPALYLGFDRPFPNRSLTLNFLLADAPVKTIKAEVRSLVGEEFASAFEEKTEQRVFWEYWNGKAFTALMPRDLTENFTHSGEIEFQGPKDFQAAERFGEKLFWLRARLEMGGYIAPPRLKSVLLNSVLAVNAVTIKNEVLGSSDGTPDQAFSFARTPILEGTRVVVRESVLPPPEELEQLKKEEGEDCCRLVKDSTGKVTEVWVRWHQVDGFYNSLGTARHYILEPITGQIRFGDGRRGLIPPPGRNNIVAEEYRTGGGLNGNVAAGTIKTLRQALPYIQAVSNPIAATGGSDQETLEEAKIRAPQIFRNRFRAVTVEDFESLTLQSSSNIARAKCIPTKEKEGEVTVVIVPKDVRKANERPSKPVPSQQLLNLVENYLTPRKLLTTRLRVCKPRYVEVSLFVTLALRGTGVGPERVRREVEERLRNYLSPLFGGPQGKGWQFGKGLFKTDLYHLIEDVDGVDFVEKLEIYNEDRNLYMDKIVLAEDELFHLVDISISEARREF